MASILPYQFKRKSDDETLEKLFNVNLCHKDDFHRTFNSVFTEFVVSYMMRCRKSNSFASALTSDKCQSANSCVYFLGVGEKIDFPMHRDSLFNDSELGFPPSYGTCAL